MTAKIGPETSDFACQVGPSQISFMQHNESSDESDIEEENEDESSDFYESSGGNDSEIETEVEESE